MVLIQLSYVNDVALRESGALELPLKSGAVIEVSRRQSSQFKSIFAL